MIDSAGHMPLELRSDFPNGNGKNFTEVAPDHWTVELEGELDYAPWFHIEVRETVGRIRNLKLDILALPSNPDVLTECDRPVMKVDNEPWRPIPEKQVSIQKSGETGVFSKPIVTYWEEGQDSSKEETEIRPLSNVSINVEIPAFSIVSLAFTYPYTYYQLLYFIRELSTLEATKKSYVQIKPVGLSEEQRALQLITLTDPAEITTKDSLFMTFRMHPGLEASSSWASEAIIRSLLDGTPKSLTILKNFVVHIIPMANVDGVYHGNERYNAGGVDLWLDFGERKSKEASSIYQAMMDTRPVFYIDWHGWLCHDKGVPPFDGVYFDLSGVSADDRRWYQRMIGHMREKVPAFGSHSIFVRLGPHTAPRTLYREMGTLSCVLEVNPAFSSIEHIRERSVSYFHAFCEFLINRR